MKFRMSELVRTVAHRNNVSLKEIGSRMGYKETTFRTKMHRDRPWRMEDAIVLRDLYGVSLDEFIDTVKA